MSKVKKIIKKVAPTLILLMIFAPALAIAADVTTIGASLSYASVSLIATVVNIVNWILGILALIAVIMIIYGGFRWMMAGGNEENVDKAKKLISAAVIGLIIVLLAWAIVIFVINVTNEATTTR